jgi:hypothetical protein
LEKVILEKAIRNNKAVAILI